MPLKRTTLFLVLLCGYSTVFLRAQGRNYARSMVITQQGIVATSQALASQAGTQILARGGSAVDAAIAANAVLAVTEPMMDGLGGDLFCLYWDSQTGKLTGLNASGPAPRALTPEFLHKTGYTAMPSKGIHSVTVPGAVDGWARMHQRYGKLPWKDLFQSAILYAEKGFPVTEIIQGSWNDPVSLEKLQPGEESSRVFLPGGKPPQVGQLFRNPGMAKAFRLIAEKGRDAYYKGEIAQAILSTSRRQGGTMTAEDLAGFSSEWVTPISTDYRGWKIYELPPNGQGMAALEMLNIMETAPAKPGSPLDPAEMHKRIEAMKLAYSDLYRYDADPHFSKVPVQNLLSKDYARKRAALIDPHKANCDVAPGQPVNGDTTYLTVVDRDGNMVSWIQSVSHAFGSGVAVDGMGFILQNRGFGFTLEPNHPNVLAGGKRPFHTIIPAFMERGDTHIGFGIMGGPNQPLAHAQFVSDVVDYGMNVQEALETARWTKTSAHGCDVSIEDRVPLKTLQQLSEWGHEVRIRRDFTLEMGRGQAILHDSKTGTNYAGSDPRADGAANPEPIVPYPATPYSK
ncbi:MAG TPA: gamma-glutamyltransferase [Bryobacteraceae bacterium]|jgi:gamma-glutamyltranspeptidase/glutathione hydrolase